MIRKQTKKSTKLKSSKKSKKSYRKSSRKMSKSKIRGAKELGIEKINDHLDKIDTYLEKNKLFSFYYFPDEKGFKNKISGDIEKIIKKDVDKYKERSVARISICTNHREPNSLPMKHGILVTIQIIIFKIENNGKLKQFDNNGIVVRWEEDDFNTGKLSFKLIERLMRIVYSKRYSRGSESLGTKLSKMVGEIKKKGIPIDDVLEPL